MTISFAHNPQKMYLDFTGTIEFPNLTLETLEVDFGCCLLDTMQRRSVVIKNPGLVAVDYSWSWLKQEVTNLATGALLQSNTSSVVFWMLCCIKCPIAAS